MEEINRQVGQEARMALQVSVQLARFFADIQRRALEHARRESWEQERLIRQTINDQRRLADPVLRQGLDERFWDKAQPKDAAYVWGVAERFKSVDPLAAQAADRCRREALERWNIDLDAPARPVTPGEVDDATLAEVAPVVEGEENRDLRADLEASAQEASQEAEKVAEQVSTDPEQLLAAEEHTAWEWAQRHYDVESLYPGIDEAARRQEAHVLYSSLAAEGYDLDHPPALDQLGGELDEAYAIETSVGAGSDFTAQTGISAYDFEHRVDPHDHAVAQRAWDAERQGRYPNPRAWRESVVLRGSEAVREVNRVQLADAPGRRGTYTELARRSAAGEAERAGMRPEEYLDHLGAHQRRAVVSTRGQMDEQRAAGMGRMAAYRIAYAREAAARWSGRGRGQDQGRKSTQDQASRSRQTTPAETGRGQQVDQGRSAAASGNGADLEAQARASWAQGDADDARAAQVDAQRRAQEAQADAQRARQDRDGQDAGMADTVGEVVTPLAVAGTAAVTATAVWDSPEARAVWADAHLANGHDPQVVRAAVAGDRALHEPAHRATAPSKAPSTEGRRPKSIEAPSRTQKQHM